MIDCASSIDLERLGLAWHKEKLYKKTPKKDFRYSGACAGRQVQTRRTLVGFMDIT
jgi:hypothetical protein